MRGRRATSDADGERSADDGAMGASASRAARTSDANPTRRVALIGDAFVDSYLKLRRAHWDEYAADLSPWEWRAYLDS